MMTSLEKEKKGNKEWKKLRDKKIAFWFLCSDYDYSISHQGSQYGI